MENQSRMVGVMSAQRREGEGDLRTKDNRHINANVKVQNEISCLLSLGLFPVIINIIFTFASHYIYISSAVRIISVHHSEICL